MTNESRRLRHLGSIQASNVDKKSAEGDVPVRLCNYVDVYRNDLITDDLPFMSATATHAQVATFELQAGDVILTKDSERPDDIGVPAYVPEDLPGTVCGYHLSVVRTNHTLLHPKFLSWFLKSQRAHDHFTVSAQGITRFALGYSELGNTPVPLPPIEEQRAIVLFLDEETAKIDALIERNRRLNRLLEEEMRAKVESLIHRQSDVSIQALKRVAPFVTSGSRGWAAYYAAEGENFIRIGNLRPDSIDLKLDYVQKVQPPVATETLRTVARPGDVLVSITAQIGSVGVVPAEFDGYVNQHVALCRPIPEVIESKWLAYCLFSDSGQKQFARELYGGTKQGLGLDDVKALRIPVPSLETQREKLRQLDHTMAEGIQIIGVVDRALGLLQEHRSALITAAVTGQIDVGSAA